MREHPPCECSYEAHATRELSYLCAIYAAPSGALVPVSVRAGDVVTFGKYAGDPIEIDGVKCLIMREENVFAILERGD